MKTKKWLMMELVKKMDSPILVFRSPEKRTQETKGIRIDKEKQTTKSKEDMLKINMEERRESGKQLPRRTLL